MCPRTALVAKQYRAFQHGDMVRFVCVCLDVVQPAPDSVVEGLRVVDIVDKHNAVRLAVMPVDNKTRSVKNSQQTKAYNFAPHVRFDDRVVPLLPRCVVATKIQACELISSLRGKMASRKSAPVSQMCALMREPSSPVTVSVWNSTPIVDGMSSSSSS